MPREVVENPTAEPVFGSSVSADPGVPTPRAVVQGSDDTLRPGPQGSPTTTAERELRSRIDELSSELERERQTNQRLRERLRDVYRNGGLTPYAAFLASEEAETIPRSFWPTLEGFLWTFPIRLQEGEATQLYQNWDIWDREELAACESDMEASAAYLWSPEARAIELLGPRRILTELTNEELQDHWTTTERAYLEAVFGPCCPERVAELNAMYPPW